MNQFYDPKSYLFGFASAIMIVMGVAIISIDNPTFWTNLAGSLSLLIGLDLRYRKRNEN